MTISSRVAAAGPGHHATRRDSEIATPCSTAAVNGSKPDVAVLEFQTESFGRGATHRLDFRAVGLRDQHDTPVVAEVHVAQLRMAIEAEPLPQECLEVLGEEVGEEEGAELFFVHGRELIGAAEELVAVRPRQPGCFGVPFEQGIERATRSAVGVGDEHVATLSHRLVE